MKANVFVKTQNGWELLFKDIDEAQAHNIWAAGFATGENKISIETETDRQIREMNRRTLGLATEA